jgi:hypothetical protein
VAGGPAGGEGGPGRRQFRACTTMALTGISLQHPDATPEEVRYQFALRRYGREFADEWYGVASGR